MPTEEIAPLERTERSSHMDGVIIEYRKPCPKHAIFTPNITASRNAVIIDSCWKLQTAEEMHAFQEALYKSWWQYQHLKQNQGRLRNVSPLTEQRLGSKFLALHEKLLQTEE